MEIVVRGRKVVVPDHFRQHVGEKLGKLERYDDKIIRVDVELQHEKNPRQNGSCQHIEITCRTRGPVVRSEACSDDFYAALDLAVDKLERRLRHAADRRRIHHGRRTPRSVAEVTAALPDLLPDDVASAQDIDAARSDGAQPDAGPGQVVRSKEHPATPMTVDQALFEMELVGHDFFLFCDSESGRPSVVYRRHAYDYGLLRLAVT
ncbi:ribosome hibernation-promoting factor, HPF/YfiA family [uncultured Jatrophihabitans sp.]|uniref:ribosome hibernation-promoting factor, HPF/YfiA family n=1 Tax=uncultured Jatrophihabitans sp. TaxID=1610747 RepID=UPI0035CC20DD